MSKKLQKEKLQLEIAELNKKWYQKPDLLKVLLPTILAIFSLIYAITSGFFSSKSELLELKRQQLKFEITQFQKEREELLLSNKELENKKLNLIDSLKSQSKKLGYYVLTLNSERDKKVKLNSELVVLKNTRNNFNRDIQILEEDYNKKKEKYLNEIETKYYQEIDSQRELSVLNDSVRGLNNEIEALEYNLALFDNAPIINKTKKLELKVWQSREMVKFYEQRGGVL